MALLYGPKDYDVPVSAGETKVTKVTVMYV